MRFPRLKNALLCRVIVYASVIGAFVLPIILVIHLRCIPEAVKVVVSLGYAMALPVFILKNFAFLMGMDLMLAALHCQNTARKQYPLTFSVEKRIRKLSRFGKDCEPLTLSPRPTLLRCKSSPSMTIYAKRVEKLFAVYDVDVLDKDQYHRVVNAAMANIRELKGSKKHFLLNKDKKKVPIQQTAVILLRAKRVDAAFRKGVFDAVCKNGGDGYDTAILPCVMDMETGTVTFDSLRIPYMGFQYPAKNRGIRMIRTYLFGGKLPFSEALLAANPEIDTEQSLWSFWKAMKKEWRLDGQQTKKRFETMTHRQILLDEDVLYLKWEGKGVWFTVERNEQLRIAEIDDLSMWDYPKATPISKATVKELKTLIHTHFAQLGYTVHFTSYEQSPEP